MATSSFYVRDCAMFDSHSITTNFQGTQENGAAFLGATKTALRRSIGVFDIFGTARTGNPIATDDTITAAQIDFDVFSAINSNVSYRFQRITRDDWVDTEATWTIYKTANNWTTGGGDVNVVTPAEVVFTGPAATGTFSLTGLSAHAVDAQGSRSGRLHYLIRLTDESGADATSHIWVARGGDSDSLRPILTVTYTPAQRRGQVTQANLEVGDIPRRAQITQASFEMGDAPAPSAGAGNWWRRLHHSL